MIRTIAVYAFVVPALIFVLPLLILWTIITQDANFMYWTFIGALRVTMRIAGIHIRAEGAENIPPGVCIFASNHASNIDPVALVPHIPRRVALLAKKEVFRVPILSKALHLAKLVPVDRADKEAAAESVDTRDQISEGRPFVPGLSRRYAQPRRPSDAVQEGNFRDGHSRRRQRRPNLARRNPAPDAQRRLDHPPRRSQSSASAPQSTPQNIPPTSATNSASASRI